MLTQHIFIQDGGSTTLRERMNAIRERVDNEGFTLLELVVAVSIILIITATGAIGYQGIQSNARDAAVESAAQTLYTGAQAERHAPGAPDYAKVKAEYDATADGISTRIDEGTVDVCVQTIYDSHPSHTAKRGDCSIVDPITAPGEDGSDNTGDSGDNSTPGDGDNTGDGSPGDDDNANGTPGDDNGDTENGEWTEYFATEIDVVQSIDWVATGFDIAHSFTWTNDGMNMFVMDEYMENASACASGYDSCGARLTLTDMDSGEVLTTDTAELFVNELSDMFEFNTTYHVYEDTIDGVHTWDEVRTMPGVEAAGLNLQAVVELYTVQNGTEVVHGTAIKQGHISGFENQDSPGGHNRGQESVSDDMTVSENYDDMIRTETSVLSATLRTVINAW